MRQMICLTAAMLGLVAADARAQERPPRRQAPIEIRGTVPTPQVVTVRPREIPAYSRKILVPNFYDHDFWPSILPPYEMVPERAITGQPELDSAAMRRDTTMMPMMRYDSLGIRPDTSGMRRDTLGMRADSLGVRRDSLGRLVPPPANIDSARVRPDSMRRLPPVPPPPPPPADRAVPMAGTAPAPSTRR